MSLLTISASVLAIGAGAKALSLQQGSRFGRKRSMQEIVQGDAARLTGANGHSGQVIDAPGHGLSIAQQGKQWQASLAATLRDVEEEYQWFMKTKVDPLFQGKRYEMMQEISVEEEVVLTPRDREINRFLAQAGLVVTAALVTAPLGGTVAFLVCIPLAFYPFRYSFKEAYTSIKEERRLTLSVLMVVNQLLLWFGGFYLLAGIIYMLISIGQKITYNSEVKSQKRLANVFGQLPRHVWVLQQNVEVEIPFSQLQTEDVLVVRAGQMIPVDGVILAGNASIDQHRLTGEAQPAEKGAGDAVLASTVVLAGWVHVRVEKTGQETVAAQIGEMLDNTASYQMAITTKAFQVANKSVGPTLVVAGVAGLMLGPVGATAITSTMFGINVMISGPLALRNYLAVATRRSILIKDSRSLDLLPEIDTVIFDKTGTLTLDQPHVAQIHVSADFSGSEVLRLAAAVEQHQSHPIARAILTYAKEQTIALPAIDKTRIEMGYGLHAVIDEQLVRVGSDRFMASEQIEIPAEIQIRQEEAHALGHSLVMVAVDDQVVGAIELQPTIRPEAQQVIDELRQRGLSFYIISGDQEGPTRKLADSLGIEHYFANVLPENKAKLVEQLQAEGRAVCFVGDGINDSIALKKANVSVSLRGSTTVAMDTAQIVLMDTTLTQLPLLFKLGEEMAGNLKLTQALAVVPTLGIWGGVLFLHLGILGAAAIFEGSLWVGIANAMRPLWKYRDDEPLP